MNVIHLPSNVGGNVSGISRNLNALDIKSEVWVLEQNYFLYPADKVLFKKSDGFLIRNIKKISLLRYIFYVDIVFFNFGSALFDPFWSYDPKKLSRLKRCTYWLYSKYSALMSSIEMFLIKLMNVKVFIQYQGDDARQGDVFSKFEINFVNQVDSEYYTEISDNAKRARIEYLCAHAHKVYALNPDLKHVLPASAEFLPYSNVDIKEWMPVYTQMLPRALRIGHAPSHRGVKGTDLIIKACDQLKSEGFDVELVLIEGVSHDEAMETYKTVDVVVDQIYAGWYGGLAVEVMALGKPVIAYIRDQDLEYIPEKMRNDLPIIRVEPSSIYEVLNNVTCMPRSELLDIAKKSRAYVEHWHDPMDIAKRIKKDMQDAIREIC
jgi:glycosyltransferase involved in cell wall biosynthesis